MYSTCKPCTVKIPDNLNSLNSICSDGCNLYLTSCDKNYILVMKIYDNTTFRIKLPTRVDCICYDPCEHLFLIKPSNCNDHLLQISETGDVIGKVSLNFMLKSCGKLTINCITFNEICNTIIISVNENNNIYVLDKLGRVLDVMCNLEPCKIRDLKVCYDYLFVYTANKITVYNNCFDKICVMKISTTEDDVLLVNKIDKANFLIFLATCENCTICLSKYVLSEDKFCKHNECHTDEKCNNISRTPYHKCDPCDPHFDDCHTHGDDDDCHKFKIDPQNIYDLIESIALEEAGLAHIINAEGEKIQKAVQTCKTPECLISVNKSVKETLEQIVQFEMILNSKLKTAHEMLELLFKYKCCYGDDCDCDWECDFDCNCKNKCNCPHCNHPNCPPPNCPPPNCSYNNCNNHPNCGCNNQGYECVCQLDDEEDGEISDEIFDIISTDSVNTESTAEIKNASNINNKSKIASSVEDEIICGFLGVDFNSLVENFEE